MSEAPATIGSNNPPLTLQERLERDHAALLADIKKWLGSAERAPEVVESEKDFQDFGTICGKLITFRGSLTKVHDIEKEPFLRDGRIVDNFTNPWVTSAKGWQSKLEARQNSWGKKKEAAARAAATKAEEKARAKSDADLQAAQRLQDEGRTDEAMDRLSQAAASDDAAQQAAVVAEAKPANLVQTHAVSGAVTSAKAVWSYEIEDMAKVPLESLRPYIPAETIDKAVKAAVRGGVRQLAGVRIFEDRKIVNKGI